MRAATKFKENIGDREVDESDREAIQQGLVQSQVFPGLDFLIGNFYEEFSLPLEHFGSKGATLWFLNSIEVAREADVTQDSA